MKTDSQLRLDILEQLRADERIGPSVIDVAVHDGSVTLSGVLDNFPARAAAARAANRVAGVRSIQNEILVHLAPHCRRTDDDIAHDAACAMSWDIEVPDHAIKTRVHDAWIWISGEADWHYQRLAAERAVENIVGVRGVTNLVRIKPRVPDTDTKAQIEAALQRNARLGAQQIAVVAQEGSVFLFGVVWSCLDRMAAEETAWSAPGVTEVDNRVEVAA